MQLNTWGQSWSLICASITLEGNQNVVLHVGKPIHAIKNPLPVFFFFNTNEACLQAGHLRIFLIDIDSCWPLFWKATGCALKYFPKAWSIFSTYSIKRLLTLKIVLYNYLIKCWSEKKVLYLLCCFYEYFFIFIYLFSKYQWW